MTKKLILVHGRDFKPKKQTLEENWQEALRYGIARDFGDDKATKFDALDKMMVYYGNLSNKFLRSKGREYNENKDILDRRKSIDQLKTYVQQDFNEDIYNALPGKSFLKEALADTFSTPLSWFGLSDALVEAVAPDMGEYWNPDSAWGSDIRWTLTEPLSEALKNEDDIMLISHSLGTMIAYDVLWKFSHYGEYQYLRDRQVKNWITMGSPLSDETVKNNLKGASATGKRKYPTNVRFWTNVAAEDDYISHDSELANDFEKMLTLGCVESIEDIKVYNLAIRGGKTNPHHGGGYLIHPELSELVADWLD